MTVLSSDERTSRIPAIEGREPLVDPFTRGERIARMAVTQQ
ncbi:hypothetical protein AB0E63_17805 [Kribbella sp. NPDC026596]